MSSDEERLEASDRRARLLVIESAGRESALVELLERAGYKVDVFTSGVAALQWAPFARWDGALVDLDLPGIDGTEVYAYLLCALGVARLPVIFLSARKNRILELALGDAEWARLVYKPWEIGCLLEDLERCLAAPRHGSLSLLSKVD